MKKKMLLTMLALVTAMTMSLAGCGSDAPAKENTKEEVVTEKDTTDETEVTDPTAGETDADVQDGQDDQDVEVTEEPPVEVEDPEAYLSDSEWLNGILNNNMYYMILTDANGKYVHPMRPSNVLQGGGCLNVVSDRVSDRLVYEDTSVVLNNEVVDMWIVAEAGLDDNFTALKNGDASAYTVLDNYYAYTARANCAPEKDKISASDVSWRREYGIVTTSTDAAEIEKYKGYTGIDGDVTLIRYYIFGDISGVYAESESEAEWEYFNGLRERNASFDELGVNFDYDIMDAAYTVTILVPSSFSAEDIAKLVPGMTGWAFYKG